MSAGGNECWGSLWWRTRLPAEAAGQGGVPARPLWRVQGCARCCALAYSVFQCRSSTLACFFNFIKRRVIISSEGQANHKSNVAQVQEQYLACLKEHANQAEACRELAKTYLECRMDRCD